MHLRHLEMQLGDRHLAIVWVGLENPMVGNWHIFPAKLSLMHRSAYSVLPLSSRSSATFLQRFHRRRIYPVEGHYGPTRDIGRRGEGWMRLERHNWSGRAPRPAQIRLCLMARTRIARAPMSLPFSYWHLSARHRWLSSKSRIPEARDEATLGRVLLTQPRDARGGLGLTPGADTYIIKVANQD